jgi:hypothetical protein
MYSRKRVCVLQAVFGFLAGAILHATGATMVYENFAYAVGATVSGQNGGTGFAGAWMEAGTPAADLDTVQGGSLTFGALQTSGESVQSLAPSSRTSDYQRDIADIPGTTGTSLWLSFLIRRDTAAIPGSDNAFGLLIYPSEGAGIFVGDPAINNFYFLGDRGDGEFASTSVPVTPFVTAFLVLRIDFLAGADTIRLFVNPAPGGPAPTVASATKTDRDLATIDRIGVFSVDSNGDPRGSIDEIRIGSSFSDVAPVPEASSVGLFAIGALVLSRRKRNSRSPR